MQVVEEGGGESSETFPQEYSKRFFFSIVFPEQGFFSLVSSEYSQKSALTVSPKPELSLVSLEYSDNFPAIDSLEPYKVFLLVVSVEYSENLPLPVSLEYFAEVSLMGSSEHSGNFSAIVSPELSEDFSLMGVSEYSEIFPEVVSLELSEDSSEDS